MLLRFKSSSYLFNFIRNERQSIRTDDVAIEFPLSEMDSVRIVVLLDRLLIYIDNASADLPMGNIISDPRLEMEEQHYVHS